MFSSDVLLLRRESSKINRWPTHPLTDMTTCPPPTHPTSSTQGIRFRGYSIPELQQKLPTFKGPAGQVRVCG